MGRWSERLTLQFVQCYKEQNCLWNRKSPFYLNKQARQSAYEVISGVIQDPEFGVEDVKNKIKNLRSTYYQEVKKVKTSMRSGKIYKPNVVWFKEMDEFLGKVPQVKKTQANIIKIGIVPEKNFVEEDRTSFGQEHSDDQEESIKREFIVDDRENGSRKSARKSTSFVLPTVFSHINKKRKLNSSGNVSNSIDQLRELTMHSTIANDDEFNLFGLNIAAQLRLLPLDRALHTQVKIQTLLAEERIAASQVFLSSNQHFAREPSPIESPVSSDSSPETCLAILPHSENDFTSHSRTYQ